MNKNIINKKIILFICVFILLLTIFDFIILILLSRKTIIATNVIFKNSINSIVELKAKTEGYGENFGTAFFINDDGYLITAAHVVTYKEAKKIKIYEEFYIRFATEKEYNLVKLIKFDIDKDLAYLKLSKNKNIIFESIKFKKKNIEYGEEVYAIGNGLNQGISITKGIISMPFVNIKNNDLTRNLIQVNIEYHNSKVIEKEKWTSADLEKILALATVVLERGKNRDTVIYLGRIKDCENVFKNDEINNIIRFYLPFEKWEELENKYTIEGMWILNRAFIDFGIFGEKTKNWKFRLATNHYDYPIPRLPGRDGYYYSMELDHLRKTSHIFSPNLTKHGYYEVYAI